jgi:hypothetical protein
MGAWEGVLELGTMTLAVDVDALLNPAHGDDG